MMTFDGKTRAKLKVLKSEKWRKRVDVPGFGAGPGAPSGRPGEASGALFDASGTPREAKSRLLKK